MKRRDEVLVGILATVALALGIIGALWLAQGSLKPGYSIYTKFAWGAGLKQGQPVLLSGVTVGNVEDVILRPDGMLVVKLRVRRQFKVPLGTTATIEPNGFFGDQLVALHPGKPTTEMYKVNDTILTGRPTPSIGDVLSRVDTIAGRLSILTEVFTKELVEKKGFEDFHKAIVSANAMFAEVQRVAAVQSAEFTKTQEALRHASTAFDSAQISSTLKELADGGAAVKELSANWSRTSAHLDSLMDKASKGNGSLARFLNDPSMHDDFQRAVRRLDSLMTDFQKNPRKYIKLSIF